MNHVTTLADTVLVVVKMAISVKCVTIVSYEFYITWVTYHDQWLSVFTKWIKIVIMIIIIIILIIIYYYLYTITVTLTVLKYILATYECLDQLFQSSSS